ncbi:MAG: response regulator receiver modulated diguanylate cyclase [Proteobacteria bacterium]|nr:response regulator receiver modulated diguanylate cyclase [Pseudomonadota bacterium]
MSAIPHAVIALAETLERRWKQYLHSGNFDAFVEFTLSLNGLTEQLDRLSLPGLVRACQELENLALTLFGGDNTHPIGPEDSDAIQRQLTVILRELHRHETPAVALRQTDQEEPQAEGWNRPRDVLIVSRPAHPWTASLFEQLQFFGFHPHEVRWEQELEAEIMPLAVIFVPDQEGLHYPNEAIAYISKLRKEFSASFFYCLSVPSILESIVHLQRAGADACVPVSDKVSDVLSRILDLVQTKEQTVPRVLVVEDSATAVAHIRRSLSQHGIDSRAIGDPRFMLEAAVDYRPDVILMDMYMPFCTGVEVTRALRQLPEYQSVPVVYLSSETDIAQQVEALRLGGDQFLTKPVNPIVLAAVVKTKIDRYRDMMRSGRLDSLTGLLNHTAAKNRLEVMIKSAEPTGLLAVAMIDIDRFKSVNDTWGHPVGDQVIRSLAWLLRGRLRSSDLIGRYGGEEFLVALSGVDIEKGVAMLNRIREDFSALPHAHAHGTLRCSFSCGVSSLADYSSGSALIEAADNALLEAKRSGRNRVISAAL